MTSAGGSPGLCWIGVPRLFPSDFAIDFTRLPPGTNRNLDLWRKFQQRLDAAPIAVTSVLSGRFTDLLTAPGGLGRLQTLIGITRALLPGRGEVFPPWQGMQFLRDMFSGLPKLEPLDNGRYPALRWTTVREVLAIR